MTRPRSDSDLSVKGPGLPLLVTLVSKTEGPTTHYFPIRIGVYGSK